MTIPELIEAEETLTEDLRILNQKKRVELIPAAPGEEINHRYMKVCGYGSYRGDDGENVEKPQIVLNAKWLAEAGFHVGDQIDVCVTENELVIKKLIPA